MYVYHLKIRCIDVTQSLPMRECGLKPSNTANTLFDMRSLPMRECGLKHDSVVTSEPFGVSLPMRECGLKLRSRLINFCRLPVTPHAGVWIETEGNYDWSTYIKSLPMRECGLKPRSNKQRSNRRSHSPCGSVD